MDLLSYSKFLMTSVILKNKLKCLWVILSAYTFFGLHHLDFNEMSWEKAWWELWKDASYCFKQSSKQHSSKQLPYSHLPFILQTIQVRWTQHAGHCWRSKDELIINILLWTPTHGHTSVSWPAKIYIHQL